MEENQIRERLDEMRKILEPGKEVLDQERLDEMKRFLTPSREVEDHGKIRPYRVVIHNAPVTQSLIEDIASRELGDVEVVSFELEREINYTAGKDMPHVFGTSQREYIVTLEYKEK